MNKSIVISFFVALIFAACTSAPKSYIIEGVVPDESYNNQMVYMRDIETREITDSALVVDEKFTFTGSVDNAVIRRLILNRLITNFVLENGTIFVDMAVPESAKGTPMNDEMSKFQTEMNVIRQAFFDKQAEVRQLEDIDEETREKQYDENFKQYKTNVYPMYAKFFNVNTNNALGTFILYEWSDYLEIDQMDTLYAQAGDVVRNSKRLQNIIETNAKKRLTTEGMPFTNFTIENGTRDGNSASLSDYVGKGKYVLVDFWASWCGPCIAEIPVLVEVYNSYKGDKFEILGVAVWEKREVTMNYLESNNTPWPQIIGADDIPTELYGITGIPHIILFGPDGKIVARRLRGNRLKEKVAEVM